MNMNTLGNIVSDATGGLRFVVGERDVTLAAQWSSISGLYDEYRVLAYELEYFPANRYSKTVVNTFPILGVIDHDDAAPLTTAEQAIGYESARILTLDDPWTDRKEYRGSSVPSLKMYMSGPEESGFLTTATTGTSQRAILLFAAGGILTPNTTYGLYLVRWLVQFRGRSG